MASLRVLAFDHEGRSVQFDTWLDDLQLYLLSDSKDTVLLFDLASGPATAPPATADSATRSHWLTRDGAARLAIRNHLTLAECAHFGQHRTTHALYDTVVARYSSPATAAQSRLLLPYLFPELSAFATVEDLVSHLRTSDARYRATVPAEFLDRNQPPMFITLYFIVTRLPDSLRSVRDHFLSLDPTSLTVDLLEQHLFSAETSAVAVGAARGTPRPPFFEGCSPSPLAPSYASAAAADVSVAEDVEAASASAKRCSSKGKGRRGVGGGSGGGGGGSGSGGGGSSGSGGKGGTGGGSGGSGGGGGGSGGSGGSGGGGTGGGRTGPRHGGLGGGQRQQQQCQSETQSPQQLRIAAAAVGSSESGTLLGIAPVEALHTFTLDSGTSRCFFRDITTLTPLPALVPVRLADPSGGPVVARSSSVLSCPAVLSGSLSGLHLPSFSTNLAPGPSAPSPLAPRPIRPRPLGPLATATATSATAAAATAAPASSACCATMASLRVLAFDHEGRPVQFDTWLDDLQLATRSQWLTRDAAARLAIRNHQPLAECAHFGQHRTAQALYNAVVARYSSPAIAALGCLLLPYLVPEMSAFATVEDLVSHLRDSDARYRAAAPAELLDKNQPPMFITLYFIVTRLPDSLRSVRDHFLSLDPTSLTVDLLEQHLLAAETSAVAV
ncbi:unnamed protein product, partial [Closterium sp. NIES-53]